MLCFLYSCDNIMNTTYYIYSQIKWIRIKVKQKHDRKREIDVYIHFNGSIHLVVSNPTITSS